MTVTWWRGNEWSKQAQLEHPASGGAFAGSYVEVSRPV